MLAKKKSRVIGALLWPRYGRSKHDKDVTVVSAYGNLIGLCRSCDLWYTRIISDSQVIFVCVRLTAVAREIAAGHLLYFVIHA